jgi:hypothetical protein
MTRVLAVLLLVLGSSCSGDQAAERAHDALDALTAVADPAYEAALTACLATERLVLARAGDEQTWARARDEIRGVCDPVAEAFEAARAAQEKAREAVEACRGGVDAPCVGEAVVAVEAAEEAARAAAGAWSAAKPVLDRYTGAD